MEVNGLCIISENHESFLPQKVNHLRYYLTDLPQTHELSQHITTRCSYMCSVHFTAMAGLHSRW